MSKPIIAPDYLEKFLSHIIFPEDYINDCWGWIGYKNKLGIAKVESNRDWSINNQLMNKAEILSYFTSAYLTGNEPLCRNLVPIEGIVLVNPLLKNYVPYKLISQSFKEKEIVELDKGIVDTETLN